MRVPRRRDRQTAIALAYPSSTYRRANFDAIYARHCHDVGKRVSQRGLETRWAQYQGIARAIRRQRGAIRTTNGQRAQQLANNGRARSTRTVRRGHRELEAMGLIIVRHVVKSGPARVPGKLDCLAVALCPISGQSFVRPLRSRGGLRPLTPACNVKNRIAPPTAAKIGDRSPTPQNSPPPADRGTGGQNCGQEGDLGFIHPFYVANPGMLRFVGDPSRPPDDQKPRDSGQASARTRSTTSAGFRWSA